MHTRIGCILQQGYGLTETSPAAFVTPEDTPIKPGSVGWPVANTEAASSTEPAATSLPARTARFGSAVRRSCAVI